MSFLQVAVFSGRQLGDYFLNQVARTKILVVMAPKVVTELGGLLLLANQRLPDSNKFWCE